MWTHFDDEGRPHMVDVSAKAPNRREAWAEGWVRLTGPILEALQGQGLAKGDPLPVAELAGIQGAKQTWSLIPLCHPLLLTSADIAFAFDDATHTITIEAEVAITGRTGVEMEALTAVSVAALTVYDMCKAVDKTMVISAIRLLAKSGGKSGEFVRPGPA